MPISWNSFYLRNKKIQSGEPSSGDLLVFKNDEWSRLPAGSEGQGLQISNGQVSWQDSASVISRSDTVQEETSFGLSPSAGTSLSVSRADHTHGTPANPVTDHESTYNHEDYNTHIAASYPHSGHEIAANKGAAGGYASLNSSSKVVQDPASATSTPTAGGIPIADSGGTLSSWIPGATSTARGTIKLTGQLSGTADSPAVVGIKESGNTLLSVGTIGDGEYLKRSGNTITSSPVSEIPDPATSVSSETSWGISPSAGTSDYYSRGDHTHGTPANPVVEHESTYNHGSYDTHLSAASPHSGHEITTNKGAAGGYAALDSNSKVVQDPASATSTPTASSIPIADGSGTLSEWIPGATSTARGTIKLSGQLSGTADSPAVVGVRESGNTLLSIGSIVDGEYLKRSGSTIISSPTSGSGPDPSPTVSAETAWGVSSSAGSSSNYSRGDHTHGTPSNPVISHESTYNHGNYDTHLSSASPHSGHEVVSNKGAAGGYASLNSSSKVVQDPSSASTTPTAGAIPIADSSGTLSEWIPGATSTARGTIKLTGQLSGTADSPAVVGIRESGNTLLSIGSIADGQYLKRSGSTIISSSVSDAVLTSVFSGLRLAGLSTTLKAQFFHSSRVSLWNETAGDFTVVTLSSEPSISSSGNDMSGVALATDTNYDVFLNRTSDTQAELLLSRWYDNFNRSTTWASGQAMKKGYRRTYSGTTYVCLQNHTSDNFTNDLNAGYWSATESSGFALVKGAKVFANASGMRYLWIGTVRNDATENFVDSSTKRFIYNTFNKQLRSIISTNSNDLWTSNAESWREANNGSGRTRGHFVTGLSGEDFFAWAGALIEASSEIYGLLAPALDTTSSTFAFVTGYLAQLAYRTHCTPFGTTTINGAGLHYLTMVEKTYNGTATFRAAAAMGILWM